MRALAVVSATVIVAFLLGVAGFGIGFVMGRGPWGYGMMGPGTPDPFYGYYTLHFLKDGRIEGMLSVHGNTGQVWYHSWQGDFVRMTEHHEDG